MEGRHGRKKASGSLSAWGPDLPFVSFPQKLEFYVLCRAASFEKLVLRPKIVEYDCLNMTEIQRYL